jgi:hypothetical protein
MHPSLNFLALAVPRQKEEKKNFVRMNIQRSLPVALFDVSVFDFLGASGATSEREKRKLLKCNIPPGVTVFRDFRGGFEGF